MIIDASVVGMTSKRQYNSLSQVQKAQIITHRDEAEKMGLRDSVTGMDSSAERAEDNVSNASKVSKGKNAVDQLKEAEKRLKNEKKQGEKESIAGLVKQGPHGAVCEMGKLMESSDPADYGVKVESVEDMKMNILRLLLGALKGDRGRHGGRADDMGMGRHAGGFSSMKGMSGFSAAYGKQSQSQSQAAGSRLSVLVGNEGTSGNGAALWTKTTAESVFFAETEHTQFSASGMVRTSDGREIDFGIDLEMSRGFCARYDKFVQEDYICTDPLVFNMDGTNASVTDQKFLFDIDSDGREESISFAGRGSGFLALDKNGDGRVNDGSELFGTRSGDGFKDLAEYDSDGNGWIDEADEVFKDLKIWTKDEKGKDSLVSIKEAGVGAIYLGSTDTEFSLKNGGGRTDAVIRKTGVFLKENGDVGTVQHVDLTT